MGNPLEITTAAAAERAEYARLAKLYDLTHWIYGVARLTPEQMVYACWVQLTFSTYAQNSDDHEGSSTEDALSLRGWAYPGCREDGQLFLRYHERYEAVAKLSGDLKRKRMDAIYRDLISDESLREPLRKLAQCGSKHAKELGMHRLGLPGKTDRTRLPELMHILADDVEAYPSVVARVLRAAATVPAVADALVPNELAIPRNPLTLRPVKPSTPDPRVNKAQSRLARDDAATFGKTPAKVREIQLKFAAEEGNSLHDYRLKLTNARKAREKMRAKTREEFSRP